jgi:hypothetical protein
MIGVFAQSLVLFFATMMPGTVNHAVDGAVEGMIAVQMHFTNKDTPRWTPGGFHRFRNIAVKEF